LNARVFHMRSIWSARRYAREGPNPDIAPLRALLFTPNLRAVDIWIGEEGDLGRGHGTIIMRLALARCFA